MQADYAESFDREMGCTEAELRQWLPGAARGRPVTFGATGASVAIEGGRLALEWATLPPRQIALLRTPRLAVRFEFIGVDATARREFMRYFDLYTQRGGG